MYYVYRQCNSLGFMRGPRWVIVKADSADEANMKAVASDAAEIYFDGVMNGVDCPCCGNRWERASESNGYDTLDEALVEEVGTDHFRLIGS